MASTTTPQTGQDKISDSELILYVASAVAAFLFICVIIIVVVCLVKRTRGNLREEEDVIQETTPHQRPMRGNMNVSQEENLYTNVKSKKTRKKKQIKPKTSEPLKVHFSNVQTENTVAATNPGGLQYYSNVRDLTSGNTTGDGRHHANEDNYYSNNEDIQTLTRQDSNDSNRENYINVDEIDMRGDDPSADRRPLSEHDYLNVDTVVSSPRAAKADRQILNPSALVREDEIKDSERERYANVDALSGDENRSQPGRALGSSPVSVIYAEPNVYPKEIQSARGPTGVHYQNLPGQQPQVSDLYQNQDAFHVLT